MLLCCTPLRQRRSCIYTVAEVAFCICTTPQLSSAARSRPSEAYQPRRSIDMTIVVHAGTQHGWKLDPQYKLPKMRCFGGDPRPQRIRRDPSQPPLVSEAVPDEAPAAGTAEPEEPTFALRTSRAKPPQPKQVQQVPAQTGGSDRTARS